VTNEPAFHQAPKPDFRRDIWRGLLILCALHLLQLPFALYTKGASLLVIGFTQGLYVFPALLVSLLRQRYGTAVGFLIGAALTLLLNFTVCAGAIVFQPHWN
jgi:hypothetical protein